MKTEKEIDGVANFIQKYIGKKMYFVGYSDQMPPEGEVGVTGVNCNTKQNMIELYHFVRTSDDGEKVVSSIHRIKFDDINSPYEITKCEDEISCYKALALGVTSVLVGGNGMQIGDEQYDAAVKAFEKEDYPEFYDIINYWYKRNH